MTMSVKSIGAGEFKARCLALLDEVERTGASLVVTKRGRPVAQVVAVKRVKTRTMRGSVRREGDLLSPTGEHWDAE